MMQSRRSDVSKINTSLVPWHTKADIITKLSIFCAVHQICFWLVQRESRPQQYVSHITKLTITHSIKVFFRFCLNQILCHCAGLTLPGLFSAVGNVAIPISLKYGVGLLGVRLWEHSLSALPHSHPDTSIRSMERALLHYRCGGDQVHCGETKWHENR